MKKLFPITITLLLTALAAPAAAQDIAYRGFGVRAGAGDDPDQVIGGVQFDFGEIIENLRLQPNLELGIGDDTTVISATVPVFYRYPIERLVVYGGGGLTVGWIDRDADFAAGDESDFDIAPMLGAGVEWPAGGGDLFVELDGTGGDFPGLKLMVGYMF